MASQLSEVNSDPSFTGPRASPAIPDGGSFTVYGRSTINAPAEAVFKALSKTSRWGEWNPCVVQVDVDKAATAQTDLTTATEGEIVILHAKMSASGSMAKNKEVFTQVGPFNAKQADASVPGRTVVRWSGLGFPDFVVKAEHVNWIDDNGDGTTTYQHWETFSGYAVPVIKMMYGKFLQSAWAAWPEKLKEFVEKNVKDFES